MTDDDDPARLLRDAWSIVRLDAIRDFVAETIRRLGDIEPESLLNRTTAAADFPTPRDPIGRALEACSDELRSECGSPSNGDALPARTRAIREHTLSQDGWMAIYEHALIQYRAEAAKAIRGWLDGFDSRAQARKYST
jgi:hypothetical protein